MIAGRLVRLGTLCLVLLSSPAPAAEQEFTHRILGLFAPEREEALRQAVATLSGITLVRIDFPTAEATFRFDPAVVFSDTKPENLTERLDNSLRTVSRSTFRLAPRVPPSSLVPVEIGMSGCPCAGCHYAVYEILARIEGVAAATVSFRFQRATAFIDPQKTSREALAKVLRERGVRVHPP